MASPAPLRILLVDDEPLAIERLQILCAGLPGVQLVGTAGDGEAALRLAEALRPDLLLLDIAMPGLTGIDVARQLESKPHRPAIVFVTAFDDFAVTAFDVSAVDYLLKPVSGERLCRALDRVRERAAATPAPQPWLQEIWVPHRAEIIRLDTRDIELIEAERDYMRLHLGARSFLIHQTIGELERRLDPERFVRLHRSTIVRRDRIRSLHHDGCGNWTAQLEGGRSQRIGRTYLPNVRALARA